jgi:hypothetical protein
MGVEMWYQAIPDEGALIELARQDVEIGDIFSLLPSWIVQGGPSARRPWPPAERLWKVVCELAQQHPDLMKRNCYLEKWWDKLHYLLSPNRRQNPGTGEGMLLDKAVLGDREIAEHVRGSQGAPVKYVAAPEVERIACLLRPMTSEILRVNYAPEKMEAAGVYKFWADRANESQWDAIASYFEHFRNFYLDAAKHHEGVIVVLD